MSSVCDIFSNTSLWYKACNYVLGNSTGDSTTRCGGVKPQGPTLVEATRNDAGGVNIPINRVNDTGVSEGGFVITEAGATVIPDEYFLNPSTTKDQKVGISVGPFKFALPNSDKYTVKIIVEIVGADGLINTNQPSQNAIPVYMGKYTLHDNTNKISDINEEPCTPTALLSPFATEAGVPILNDAGVSQSSCMPYRIYKAGSNMRYEYIVPKAAYVNKGGKAHNEGSIDFSFTLIYDAAPMVPKQPYILPLKVKLLVEPSSGANLDIGTIPPDSGAALDAGVPDAGALDAGVPDAGMPVPDQQGTDK